MAPAALGLQALQVVVTYLGALERRALAEVLLDVVVLHPGLSGPAENLRPVDAAPADFGEGARPLVHVRRGRISRLAVLDVPQGEPARILLEVIERVFAGARDPIAIELEVDQFRVRSPQELVVGRYAVERLELKVDRKSTRLNSSHGYISYAVFCLKKKKKNKRDRETHTK